MKPLLPPVPDLENEGIQYSKEDYNSLPFPKLKWRCCISGCDHYTSVKDIGESPLFWWRSGKVNLSTNDYYCGRHWKLYKKTGKNSTCFVYKDGPGLFHLIQLDENK